LETGGGVLMNSFIRKKVFLALTLVIMLVMFFSEQAIASIVEQPHDIKTLSGYPNPSYQEINKLLTEKALEKRVPPELVKAIAYVESGWQQFKGGVPHISDDGGIGIMQVTDPQNIFNFDQERLKYDIGYNIDAGIRILEDKFSWSGKAIPTINGQNRDVLEHWYFAVLAYNGIVQVNSPIIKADGSINHNAYQEKVYRRIKESNSGISLAMLTFSVSDFSYSEVGSGLNFTKWVYEHNSEMQKSKHLFNKNDRVVTTAEPNLRSKPRTDQSNEILRLKKGETLLILEKFVYGQNQDQTHALNNHFVWYKVQRIDGTEGYVASTYITPYTGRDNTPPSTPTVNVVTDQSTNVRGTAEAGSTVIARVGSKKIGSAVVKKDGTFSIEITKRKAGTKLTVTATDKAANVSKPRTVTVKDGTPPSIPTVNQVTDKSTKVTGKAEAGSTVLVKVGTKTLGSSKATSNGSFSIKIAKQKAGAKLVITAKDKAGNTSKARNITVKDVTPPSTPTVNKITSKSQSVTGKAEKEATVYIFNGSKKLGQALVDSKGNFNVKIKAQKKGTKLTIYAEDKAKNKSKNRVVTVG
jgi:hypothetical protein